MKRSTKPKQFDSASLEDKRRMIAQDVILQIGMGKYAAESVYFGYNSYNDSCKVCGIGACMVSLAKIDKGLSLFEINLGYDFQLCWENLLDVFGREQLALIEEIFEYRDNPTDNVIGGKYKIVITHESKYAICKAKQLFLRTTRTESLIQIMENIIRNGRFDIVEEIEFQNDKLKSDDRINFGEAAEVFKSKNKSVTSTQQNNIDQI